jgi:IS30 family transposase
MSEIARRLGRNKSSISRELGRNMPGLREVRYRANRAQLRADARKEAGHRRERLADPAIRAFVEQGLLNLGWSPEGIAGRLPLEIPGLKTNYESIYQWVYTERRDLIPCLVRAHRKRHKRSGKKKVRLTKIPNRVDISERPVEVLSREQAGHWEADTVVSRQSKVAMAVFVERKSRMYLAVQMPDKSAASMEGATVKALGAFPPELRRTITYDNGTENAGHEAINRALGTRSYFCQPYHSWEKGSIENRNGIFRRFFQKKFDFRLTSQNKVDIIIKRINEAPMKRLGFRMPGEVFADLGGVAVRG